MAREKAGRVGTPDTTRVVIPKDLLNEWLRERAQQEQTQGTALVDEILDELQDSK